MSGTVTVVDGGFSTQLARYVADPIDGDPLWSARFLATDPHAVFQTHLDYFNAGAEVVITNSYQASIDGFGKYLGLDRNASLELIKESVRLAQKARTFYLKQCPTDKKPLIAGSVGSYGATLHDGSEYNGSFIQNTTRVQLREWHRPRIQALIEAKVDLLALETIPTVEEAHALLDVLENFPNVKAWLSFQCKDGEHTAAGEKFHEVVRACWSRSPQQLVAIGCNCVDPKFVSPLLRSVRNLIGSTQMPFVVYPNSGEIYTPQAGWSGRETRVDLSKAVEGWLNLGVKYIGGCCRTDESDIRLIKKYVKLWVENKCCC